MIKFTFLIPSYAAQQSQVEGKPDSPSEAIWDAALSAEKPTRESKPIQDTPIQQANTQETAKDRKDSTGPKKTETRTWTEVSKDITASFFPWPVIAIAALIYIFRSKQLPYRLAELSRHFRSVKFLGTEIVLSEATAKQATKEAHETFKALRSEVNSEYDKLVTAYRLREKFVDFVQVDLATSISNFTEINELRCTIHVLDVLFHQTLYQLLDYYPESTSDIRRGRRWSIRYGLIGKTWRLGESVTERNVISSPKELIREWGMTNEEVVGARQRNQSFCCVILRQEGSAVGMFYMDAKQEDAFPDTVAEGTTLHEFVFNRCRERGIIADIANLDKELRKTVPNIRIYD